MNYIRSRVDFFTYLLRVDKVFLWEVILASSSFVIGLSALWFAEGLSFQIFLTWGGAVIALTGFVLAIRQVKKYGPEIRNRYYQIEEQSSVMRDGQCVELNTLEPAAIDAQKGFVLVHPGQATRESAHANAQLNTWLASQPEIEVLIGRTNSWNGILKQTADKRSGRLSFLDTLVKAKTAVNEMKFRMEKPLLGEPENILLSKVGYYDSMVTNQALRCVLVERTKNSSQPGSMSIDLTGEFPLAKSPQTSKFHLQPQNDQYTWLANGVGVSSLVLSSDNYPMLFEQLIHTIVGAGMRTVLGSGSADFQDISNAAKENKYGKKLFLDILKYAMAREACEEGSIKRLKESKEILHHAANNTLILGYFGWTARAGKPEFTGITKLKLKLSEILPDGKEVTGLERTSPVQINSLCELADFCDRARNDEPLGLSSAMALWRISQIIRGEIEDDAPHCASIGDLLELPAR